MIRKIIIAGFFVCLAASAMAGWPGSGKLYPGRIMPPPGNCPKGNIPADGCQTAPAGVAQFPHLLDINSAGTQTYGQTYVTRPPWNVAGVDYHVGINRNLYPTNANLKDPNTILSTISGASGNNSTHEVTITGNNVVIDGYDFSLNGGWDVFVHTGSGAIIRNNNFVIGTNESNAIFALDSCCGDSGTNVTITQNEFDCGGLQSRNVPLGCILVNAPGSSVTYNYFHDAWAEFDQGSSNQSTGWTETWKWNVIKDAGLGFGPTGGVVHGDWIQIFNGAGGVNDSITINYNTIMQVHAVGSGATQVSTQGLSLVDAAGNQGVAKLINVQNNTMIGLPTSFVNDFILINNACLNGPANINNNYGAPVGSDGVSNTAFLNWNHAGDGPDCGFTGTLNETGNVDVLTNGPM